MISEKFSRQRIVLTRAAGQNDVLRAELTTAFGGGVNIIELPCIEFCESDDTAALDMAIRSLGGFAWILFASQNAVHYFARRMRVLGVNLWETSRQEPRIGAIGSATAEAAAREGFSVDFVSRSGTGSDFAASFQQAIGSVAEVKILIPRSDLALRDDGMTDWPEILRESGAKVTCVEGYQTCAPQVLGTNLTSVLRDGADCFVFFSPSAFCNFANAAGADLMKDFAHESLFAAIGPTTAAAIRGAGINCAIESPEPDAKLLAEIIASHLKSMRHRSVARHAPREGANCA